MQTVPIELAVPLVRTQQVRPQWPRSAWLFAAWMSAGAGVAAVAGVGLGVMAAMEVSIGADRWTQVVQAHGRLQLFAFIAPFVAALLLEFLPRLNGTRMIPARVRVLVPGLLLLGACVSVAGTLAAGSPQLVALAGATLFAGGAIGLAIVTWSQRPSVPIRIDPQPLFLRSATGWLLVSAGLSLWFTMHADDGVTNLAGARATVETFLRGFIMLSIVGVGLRVFVGHLGLSPLGRGRQRLALVAANVSVATWLAGQGIGSLPEVAVLSRLGDFGYAFTLLLLTYWLGIMGTLGRPGRRETYELLVPVAWAALVLYAISLGLLALTGIGGLSNYQVGALRHLFLLGFVVPLMVAVGHIVLARFGTGRVEWEPALTLAFILLVAAWPMRVVPALLADAPGPLAQGVLGMAGLATVAALAMLSAVCGRTAALSRAVRAASR